MLHVLFPQVFLIVFVVSEPFPSSDTGKRKDPYCSDRDWERDLYFRFQFCAREAKESCLTKSYCLLP